MPLEALLADPDTLVRLEPEEIATHLLERFRNTTPEGGATQHLGNFINSLAPYPQQAPAAVEAALTQAWRWLDREGFITESARQAGFYYISNRGKRALESGVPASAFAKARLLPRGFLHPAIADEVSTLFIRGNYETAVLAAFRQVEIAVRAAAGYSNAAMGVQMMRDAFHPANPGPLTDPADLVGEKQGWSDLFAGAVGAYRNPAGHRTVNLTAEEAAEQIIIASHLLRIVDRRRAAIAPVGPAQVNP